LSALSIVERDLVEVATAGTSRAGATRGPRLGRSAPLPVATAAAPPPGIRVPSCPDGRPPSPEPQAAKDARLGARERAGSDYSYVLKPRVFETVLSASTFAGAPSAE
jgi:hypothetical protein